MAEEKGFRRVPADQVWQVMRAEARRVARRLRRMNKGRVEFKADDLLCHECRRPGPTMLGLNGRYWHKSCVPKTPENNAHLWDMEEGKYVGKH